MIMRCVRPPCRAIQLRISGGYTCITSAVPRRVGTKRCLASSYKVAPWKPSTARRVTHTWSGGTKAVSNVHAEAQGLSMMRNMLAGFADLLETCGYRK